ncbi:MAG TPA: class I SAM-dependent methyltransferase [Bryobacteraceae bacterium]|nr:class I SAM-dependent methyltransferase [Bryobacteraceae bacterium]
MSQLDAIYSHLWDAHTDEFSLLDRSLAPRSWTLLFEIAAEEGLGPHSVVADVGCGRGNHAAELAKRFGCRAIGIDIVFQPLRRALTEKTGGARIDFIQGDIERLPIRTGSTDFVWCRDMLVHVCDVESAIGECCRILRDRGKMLVWVTVATDLMEPREAERLYGPLEIKAGSMSQENLEAAFARAGFVVSRAEMLGSELMEFYEERDGRASRELMRLARMRRMKEQLRAMWGSVKYDSAHALYEWAIYLLLGKLNSGFYLLKKAAAVDPNGPRSAPACAARA